MGALQSCKAVDRFAIPIVALLAVASRHPAVAKDVVEGVRAANASCKRAATVMFRRALEAVCQAAGASNGTLNEKIDALREQRIISPLQAATAHTIRAFANKYGAHADDDFLDDVADDELEAVVRLTVAVVEGIARRVVAQLPAPVPVKTLRGRSP